LGGLITIACPPFDPVTNLCNAPVGIHITSPALAFIDLLFRKNS